MAKPIIMTVDDELQVLNAVERDLRRQYRRDYRIVKANSGQEGLEAVRRFKERNDAIASLTGHLLWHGIDPVVARELLLCWNRVHCRPPLSQQEVARTVESIARTHARHQEERDPDE